MDVPLSLFFSQPFAFKCLTNEGYIIDPEPPVTPDQTTTESPAPLLPSPSSLAPVAREIPHGVISLEECFSLFTSEEVLDEDNSWYCSNCKTHRQANKMIQLWKLPKVLMVGLKRFETTANPLMRQYGIHDAGGVGTHREKITTFVDFPINGLDLSPYCNQARRRQKGGRGGSGQGEGGGSYPEHQYLYDLYAVVNHYGRMGFGHYTAFVRDWDQVVPPSPSSSSSSSGSSPSEELSSTWYSYDDDLIHVVDEKTIKTSAAYILFYRQREA
jgi:ubiquitin C-terminal hydrolase